jgi:hypothetical protein
MDFYSSLSEAKGSLDIDTRGSQHLEYIFFVLNIYTMEDFYFYACVVALIILILCLTMIGITISFGNSLKLFPSTQKPCPDYWMEGTDNDAGYCLYPGKAQSNAGNSEFAGTDPKVPSASDALELNSIGTRIYATSDDTTTVDYASANRNTLDRYFIQLNDNNKNWNTIYGNAYAGMTPICAKRKWANDNGIVWDGVTNYNGCA